MVSENIWNIDPTVIRMTITKSMYNHLILIKENEINLQKEDNLYKFHHVMYFSYPNYLVLILYLIQEGL